MTPKGLYLSLENEENVSVSFTYSIKWVCAIRKFHVAVVQRRPRNVQKSSNCKVVVLPIQSCSFFAILATVATVIVIQKFCYHGDVTSYFSLLSSLPVCLAYHGSVTWWFAV